MTETRLNYIAGEWLSGPHGIENRNPSDLRTWWARIAQASGDQLDQALDAARARHRPNGRPTGWSASRRF